MSCEYRINEMCLTLQGEGVNTGVAMVLLRFQGCNLHCSFCDTDHSGIGGVGGGVFTAAASLADSVSALWPCDGPVNVLCTGGEPLLQLDPPLVEEFNRRGFRIFLETNGSIAAPEGIHWITVSPKQRGIEQQRGKELKLLWPLADLKPGMFSEMDFRYFLLQPIWNGSYRKNLSTAIEFCRKNPIWRLSLQTHRYTGIK